jgi:hypothetical protein
MVRRGADGYAVDCDWAGGGGWADLVAAAGGEGGAGTDGGSYPVTNSSRSGAAVFHSERLGSRYPRTPGLPIPG